MNQSAEQEKQFINPDKTGVASALLCTIHCVTVPVLFLVRSWWKDHELITLPSWWEKADYIFILIGLSAVYFSTRHTRVLSTKVALWFFWILLAVSILFSSQLHWLSYIASLGLIVTHLRNLGYLRKAW